VFNFLFVLSFKKNIKKKNVGGGATRKNIGGGAKLTLHLLTSRHIICPNKNMLSFLWQVFAKY